MGPGTIITSSGKKRKGLVAELQLLPRLLETSALLRLDPGLALPNVDEESKHSTEPLDRAPPRRKRSSKAARTVRPLEPLAGPWPWRWCGVLPGRSVAGHDGASNGRRSLNSTPANWCRWKKRCGPRIRAVPFFRRSCCGGDFPLPSTLPALPVRSRPATDPSDGRVSLVSGDRDRSGSHDRANLCRHLRRVLGESRHLVRPH